MATRQDDRTPEQRATYRLGVAATDRFMSGWGGAAGGTSVACWACRADDIPTVERWVRSRGEMRYVRVVSLRNYRPRCAHLHVYVVEPGHPALGSP
ncbi:MAG: hypothetical protein FJX72_03035 [Armatimonadetes bacterium]|nr:hypothetical protein [Armatimonadota bacterium]